jgi:LytS/YehU family sensor histidine kinase
MHGGEVIVHGHLEPKPDGRVELALTVRDTGAGATDGELDRGRMTGVGLRNVERRLACQYGSAASISIQSAPGRGTTVDIRLPAESSVALDAAGTARRVG